MKDGGPAFPMNVLDQGESGRLLATETVYGMSLRDYFAAHASESDVSMYVRIDNPDGSMFRSRTREEAKYAYADAMLKARD